MNIVFLDRGTISTQIRLREPSFPHRMTLYEASSSEQVAERVEAADILVVNKVRLGAAALQAAPRLRMVAIAATGSDNIDLSACARRGVVVCNIRDYATRSVPEHTFALIFALRRALLGYHDAVRAGRWQASGQFCFHDYPIRDLAGSMLGIIGDGGLGQAVASIGRALGMEVQYAAHKGRQGQGSLYTPFDDVLATSDIITLHCPLRPSTQHLIGANEFARMARRPLLINTARGGLVDESAVGPALEAGHISGAGFDVTSIEPPSAEHPFMALVGRPDFILTPHVAWASQEAMQTLADQLIDNIEAFIAGKAQNVVDCD